MVSSRNRLLCSQGQACKINFGSILFCMVDSPPRSQAKIADMVERLGRLAAAAQREEGLVPAQWEALRYLGRANRYSRSPGALAQFLGSTKGTVSQTVLALERKQLVRRTRDRQDRRGVELRLTAKGEALLERDPLARLSDAAQELPAPVQAALAAGLTALLSRLQKQAGRRSFGQCATCRFFRPNDAGTEPGGPHRCGITLEPLSGSDSQLICMEHQAAA